MTDGVYELTVSAPLTGGSVFTLEGDNTNRLFVKQADFNGNGDVNLLDFSTFRYWFGQSVDNQPPLEPGTAPAYVDLNNDGEVNLLDYSDFRNNFGTSVNFSNQSGSTQTTVANDDPEGESTSTVTTLRDVSPMTEIQGSNTSHAAEVSNPAHAADVLATSVPSADSTDRRDDHDVDTLLADHTFLDGLF